MKLLEYQAKREFAASGIATPQGRLARNVAEARAAAGELGRIAIKAQVPVGGRGKAGGVAIVDTPDEAEREAERILNLTISGYPVSMLWCEQAIDVARELYLGITLDRTERRFVLMFSAAGGMEIEQVAHESPDKVAKHWIDPLAGLHPFDVRSVVFHALDRVPVLDDQRAAVAMGVTSIARALYERATSRDALTCEINPLVLTSSGTLVAGDGKLEIDENAEYRQHLSDGDATIPLAPGGDPLEIEAKRRGLTYVHLPGGTIGCIANGAGLAMSTLDLVKQVGGAPNNFLDIGGGANAEKVRASLEMILEDPDVRGVFINIFGGITRGDEVAKGIVQARDELHMTLPLVVRMTGTNEEEGRAILLAHGITPGTDAVDAAQKVVAAVGAA